MDYYQTQNGLTPAQPGMSPVNALASQLAPLISQYAQQAQTPPAPSNQQPSNPQPPAAPPAQPTIAKPNTPSLFPNASQGQRNTAMLTSGILGGITGSPYASLAGLILPFLLGNHHPQTQPPKLTQPPKPGGAS